MEKHESARGQSDCDINLPAILHLQYALFWWHAVNLLRKKKNGWESWHFFHMILGHLDTFNVQSPLLWPIQTHTLLLYKMLYTHSWWIGHPTSYIPGVSKVVSKYVDEQHHLWPKRALWHSIEMLTHGKTGLIEQHQLEHHKSQCHRMPLHIDLFVIGWNDSQVFDNKNQLFMTCFRGGSISFRFAEPSIC